MPQVEPRISLIIPAYNEEDYLPKLLASVDVARAAYRFGAQAVQVIVADNGSTDATAAIAAAQGCEIASVEKRVIAASRNGGARLAKAPVVAFIDADSHIHPETFNALDETMSNPRFVAGSTGVIFPRWRPGIVVTVAMFMPFVWINRMDSGVVFCRREDFETIGGYNEELRFAEDLRFLADLRKLGRTRRQRLTRIPRVRAVTSDRKFSKYGDWHFIGMAFKIIWYYFTARKKVDTLADNYWYQDR